MRLPCLQVGRVVRPIDGFHDDVFDGQVAQRLKGMSRINAFPTTDRHRKHLRPQPAKTPKLFAPTIRRVAEIVPQNLILKLTPKVYVGSVTTVPWLVRRSSPRPSIE